MELLLRSCRLLAGQTDGPGSKVTYESGSSAHHGGSAARLHAAQPRHVDGGAGAAVSVRRGAVQGGEVVPRMDHQEVVAAAAAANATEQGGVIRETDSTEDDNDAHREAVTQRSGEDL
ncbi:hypothetical protein EYF80_030669 [Liparis tanakae]|uniref:Uncharacterized protein n=1 Tax=Liparis tanakae TaxID=230148 RepID=A0A4Z2H1C1_9TELE|nr:hypothetical protein EYF80_030669 [Liparis tanakae]